MIDYKLVCNEREALEGNDLQILVLLGEPLGYSSLVTIAELELLVNQAVLLQELLHAALGDVLDHRHLQLGLTFGLCLFLDLTSLVGLLLSEPALGHVALDVVVRIHEVGVQTSLLKLHLHELLYLLELGLLDSRLVLLVEDLLVDAVLVEGHGLHGSHLHGHEVTLLSGGLVGLHHGAEGVLTHVVVDLHVLTLEHEVSVELHLLTSDTRTLCDSLLGGLTVDVEGFHGLQIFALGCDGSVEDGLGQGDEVGTVGHEVGLALQGEGSGKAVDSLYEYTTIGSLTVATLGSDGQSTLAEQLLGLVEVALGLGQGLLHVGQTSACHSAKLLDIVN